jgi:hypothetical protein
MLAEGFRPVQAHLMLFIRDTDPLGGLTAKITASHMKILNGNCEIANQKQNQNALYRSWTAEALFSLGSCPSMGCNKGANAWNALINVTIHRQVGTPAVSHPYITLVLWRGVKLQKCRKILDAGRFRPTSPSRDCRRLIHPYQQFLSFIVAE